MEFERILIAVGVALGVAVNLVALFALIWKFGVWSGKITTLVDEFAKSHREHYATAHEHAQRLSHLEGARVEPH
ncbi:MAG: hypothetical protein OEO20_11280 [Gemmatimonadota bacterium]|nr:hypothetical protein [Gemmatimonadota bacterium]MDH3478875.1 hypothetical protein [Gemmatimonadota bacterium]